MKLTQLTKSVHTCLHCANTTYMEILYHNKETGVETEYDPQSNVEIPLFSYYTTYILLKCPACNKVSLSQIESCDVDTDWSGRPNEYKYLLYPNISSDKSNIPEDISAAFESALRIRNVDSTMCALALRRTLEIFCKKQGAKGKNLNDKINDLVKKNIIPVHLDQASHTIRDLGNAAAHGDDVTFNEVTISGLIKFTNLILEYVYVLPNEILAVQKQNDSTYSKI